MWRNVLCLMVLIFLVGAVAAPVGMIEEFEIQPFDGNQPPVAIISGDTAGKVGTPMVFDGTASYDPDGGEGFGSDVRVDDDTSGLWQAWSSMALAPDGSIHAVWNDDREGNYDRDIYYANSSDGGATWSKNYPINDDGFPQGNGSRVSQSTPSIAVDHMGRIHVVWWECENTCGVYYSRSDDGGKSFIKGERVSNSEKVQQWPEVAVDSNGNPHVAWFATYGWHQVYYAYSADSGQTWTPSVNVSDTWEIGNGLMAIEVDENDSVHIVWGGSRNINNPSGQDNHDVFYDSAPKGGSFGTDVMVGDEGTSLSQRNPDMSVKDGAIHIVWEDMRNSPDPDIFHGEGDIYYSYSTDGKNFSAATQVNDNSTGRKDIPAIEVDASGKVHIVWGDGRGGNATGSDIYYSTSSDWGTFSESVRVNNVTGPYTKMIPDLAVSESGNPHVMWTDARNGDYDLYFNRAISEPVLEYEWNFGDGSAKESGVTVTHIYTKAGNYTVILTVTDESGATGSDTLDIVVTGGLLPLIHELEEYIKNIPFSAFKSNGKEQNAENRRNALLSKLRALEDLVIDQEYQEALEKLEHDLIGKFDGCFGGHSPNDWIIDCSVQQQLLEYASELRSGLSILLCN